MYFLKSRDISTTDLRCLSVNTTLPSASFTASYSANATAVWKAVQVLVSLQSLGIVMLTVSNLSPIPFNFSELSRLEVFFRVNVDPHEFTSLAYQFVDERLPYPSSVLILKFGVIELNMDSGDEGVIE